MEWFELLTARVATVLGSIPESSDTVESEGRPMKQCRIKCIKNFKKSAVVIFYSITVYVDKFEKNENIGMVFSIGDESITYPSKGHESDLAILQGLSKFLKSI